MSGIPIVNGLLFAACGVLLFAAAIGVLAKAAPFDLWKQILQEKNVAVAILAGAVALAIGWIIAAAMH